jgi:hypothetical protein
MRVACASSADTPLAVRIGKSALALLEVVPGVTVRLGYISPTHLIKYPNHVLIYPKSLLNHPDSLLNHQNRLLNYPNHLLKYPNHLLNCPNSPS